MNDLLGISLRSNLICVWTAKLKSSKPCSPGNTSTEVRLEVPVGFLCWRTWRPWSICWVLLFHLLSSWSWSPPEASSSWKNDHHKLKTRALLTREQHLSISAKFLINTVWCIYRNYNLAASKPFAMYYELWNLSFWLQRKVLANKHLNIMPLYWSTWMWSK